MEWWHRCTHDCPMTRDEYPHAERTQEVSWGLEILQEKNDKQLELVVVLSECCHKIRWNVEVNLTRNSAIFHRLFHDAPKSVRRRSQDGDCVHYLMVSRVQRKPRISACHPALSTKWLPEWQRRVNHAFAQAHAIVWEAKTEGELKDEL